MNMKM